MRAERAAAVVTGASSGIGAATAHHLARAGFDLVLGARRVDALEAVAASITAETPAASVATHALDVTDTASVTEFCAAVDRCNVLVNNAGGALGTDAVVDADEEQWRWMYEANVLGVMRMTKALAPTLVDSGDGHIVVVGSIAGLLVYEGGGGYTAAKHAAHAVADTLRLELLGKPVRVTTVAPGMVETEFSVVRLAGDRDAAAAVYADMNPLTADDVADCITWCVTRPSHVDIDLLVVKPRDQATVGKVHRGGRDA